MAAKKSIRLANIERAAGDLNNGRAVARALRPITARTLIVPDGQDSLRRLRGHSMIYASFDRIETEGGLVLKDKFAA